MSSKRLYFLLLGVVSLLAIGLLAGTFGINGLLTSQADKLTSLKAKSAALAQEQLVLNKAKQDIQKYASLEQITKAIVPQDKDQAEAVREIVNIAAQSGVNLAAINFTASNLGSNQPASASSSASASTPTTSSSTSSSSASSKVGSLSQLQAVKNIPGVYVLPITVVGDPNKPVAYDKFVSFLSALEHNRRTAQVSTITIAPNPNNRGLLTFTLGVNEYIKP